MTFRSFVHDLFWGLRNPTSEVAVIEFWRGGGGVGTQEDDEDFDPDSTQIQWRNPQTQIINPNPTNPSDVLYSRRSQFFGPGSDSDGTTTTGITGRPSLLFPSQYRTNPNNFHDRRDLDRDLNNNHPNTSLVHRHHRVFQEPPPAPPPQWILDRGINSNNNYFNNHPRRGCGGITSSPDSKYFQQQFQFQRSQQQSQDHDLLSREGLTARRNYNFEEATAQAMTRFSRLSPEEKVMRKVLFSRVVVLLIQVLSPLVLPKHENDGFKTPRDDLSPKDGRPLDWLINRLLGGFLSWDGQYFLHVSTNGYTHENTMAFFPLFPMIVGIPSTILHVLLFPFLSTQSVALIIGSLVNLWCFNGAAQALLKLVKYYDHGMINLGPTVISLFCWNPASIFFSAFYSESLFAYLTFNVLLALHEKKLSTAIWYAAFGGLCRSNGLLNFWFIGAFIIRDAVKTYEQQNRVVSTNLISDMCSSIISAGLGLIPFIQFQLYCLWNFCCNNKGGESGESKLCSFYQFPYSYVQSKHWDVGFLSYFQLKQIPNFLLATPVLCTLFWLSIKRLLRHSRTISRINLFEAIPDLSACSHGAFLVLFCFLFVHVQVSTRMIMSCCPYLYIMLGKIIREDTAKFRNREQDFTLYSILIYTWFFVYFMSGAIAFPLGYPWT